MVFYFTATGNSLYVAKQLDEERLSIPQEMNKENRHYKVKGSASSVRCSSLKSRPW